MGDKLSPEELELYRRCDEILQYIWDPCSVGGEPGGRDEYYAYLPGAYKLVCNGASEDDLANYLHKIERERMGLSGDSSRARDAAKLIVSWRAWSEQTHSN